MKFKLIEKYLIEKFIINKDIINEFETLGSKEAQVRYIRDKIIGGKGNPVLTQEFRKLDEIIETSILEDGLTRSNDFLYFILDWQNQNAMNSSDANKKFTYLHDAHKNNQLDINAKSEEGDIPLYKNESLFNRPFDEFKYTVNILNMIDQGKMGQFLRDPKIAKLENLYQGGKIGGELKDSGIKQKNSEEDITNPADASTIFSTVEVWSRTEVGEGDEKLSNAFSEDERISNNRNRRTREDKKEIEKISKSISELPEEDKKRIMDDIKKAIKKSKGNK